MAKKRFALIGHHINHSISDLIHKELFSLSKIDASYELIDIAIDEFDNNIYNVIKSFDGLNVTAPYKQKIIKYLEKLDEVRIRAEKGTKSRWKNAAANRGKSLNQFVIDAVENEISVAVEKDGEIK